MCEKLLSRLSLRSFFHRALPALLLMLMPMVLLSQDSEPKLNNSSATSQTWNALKTKFQSELNGLRADLKTALEDATQSKTSLQKLTDLYNNSLMRITNLEVYNEQIGQRMQEGDEWNAQLQDENIKLEADVKVAKANGLRNTILAAVIGAAVGFFLPLIIKLLRKIKILP